MPVLPDNTGPVIDSRVFQDSCVSHSLDSIILDHISFMYIMKLGGDLKRAK